MKYLLELPAAILVRLQGFGAERLKNFKVLLAFFAGVFVSWHGFIKKADWWTAGQLYLLCDRKWQVGGCRSLVLVASSLALGEKLLPYPNRVRRHLDQLVVCYPLDG